MKSEIGLFPHFFRVLGREKAIIHSPQSEKHLLIWNSSSLYPTSHSCSQSREMPFIQHSRHGIFLLIIKIHIIYTNVAACIISIMVISIFLLLNKPFQKMFWSIIMITKHKINTWCVFYNYFVVSSKNHTIRNNQSYRVIFLESLGMQSGISTSRPNAGKVRGMTEVYPGWDNSLTLGTAQDYRSYRA